MSINIPSLRWTIFWSITTLLLALLWSQETKVENEISISATKDKIWSVLVDLDSYHKWNPTRTGTGKIQSLGQVPKWKLANGAPDTAKISIYKPFDKLEWYGYLLNPLLLSGHHYFILKSTPEETDSTIVCQGEAMSGVLPKLFWIIAKYVIEKDLVLVNKNLKSFCEE